MIKRGDVVKVISSWQVGYGRTGKVIRIARGKGEVDVDFHQHVSGIVHYGGSIEKVWRIPVKDLEIVEWTW